MGLNDIRDRKKGNIETEKQKQQEKREVKECSNFIALMSTPLYIG